MTTATESPVALIRRAAAHLRRARRPRDGSRRAQQGAEVTTANPDLPCPHLNHEAWVDVQRLTASDDDPTVIGYTTDIKINCAECGEPFRWKGVQAGTSQTSPMCSLDEFTLHRLRHQLPL